MVYGGGTNCRVILQNRRIKLSREFVLSVMSETGERRNMDFFQSPYYHINKILLYYLGQWPLQNWKEQFFFRSTTVLLVGSIMVPKTIKFVEYFGNINGMVQCVPALGLHILCAANFFNCSINEKQFKKLTCRIREDWAAKSSDFQETYLKSYAERSRILTLIYLVFLFSALWMYLLAAWIPIFLDIIVPLNESRGYLKLYETEYFVDEDKYYFFILSHAYIAMPFSVGMIIAFDTMFVTYIQHACGIFATLGARLDSIGSKHDKLRLDLTENSFQQSDEDYEKIVSCIKMHRDAAEFARLIESSTCSSFLFIFGMALLMITATGFITVTSLDKPGEALRFGTFTAAEILHVYYICWQGQVLMDHSQNVFIHAYNVNWYNISPRAKKLLILIMMRSLIPCKVTAGKLYDLSLENFTTVMKTSMSYFTVLLSMQ